MRSKRQPADSYSETRVTGIRSPEEEELERKREELESLRVELAEAELQLATRRSELIAFERHYMKVVGSRYAELDLLEALIAEAIVRRHPVDPSARRKAKTARARAQGSAEAVDDIAGPPCINRFEPSEKLKSLYRQAAKELHPDLTTDEDERQRRKEVMVQLNRAYEKRDGEAIRQILTRWRSSPDQVRGMDIASRLVRVIREIAQVRTRLARIKVEIEAIAQDELARLKQQVEEAAEQGRDLLAGLVAQVNEQIEQARAKLKQLEKEMHIYGR